MSEINDILDKMENLLSEKDGDMIHQQELNEKLLEAKSKIEDLQLYLNSERFDEEYAQMIDDAIQRLKGIAERFITDEDIEDLERPNWNPNGDDDDDDGWI